MKALCWMGTGNVEVHKVADPTILNPHDAIIKVTLTAICGSDLHLFDGFIPTMEEGDILGHEFMGIVEETGKEVTNLRRGDGSSFLSRLPAATANSAERSCGPPATTPIPTRT
jgi:threonine dehydrogenase-like Zn-dependent dehydrogenase